MKIAHTLAVVFLAGGLLGALLTGNWRIGALIFSLGAVLLGFGSLFGNKDKAVGWVMIAVGVAAVLGVVAHLLTGV